MKRIGKGLSSDDEDDDYLVSVNVVRSGKKYIVRNSIRKDMSELGRYNNLNEALSSLGNPSIDASKSSPRSGGDRNSKGNDDLWCTHCIDDVNSLYCCFCGCVYCFGKHDREKLLLCDGCDIENHIYCLEPPLSSIPSGSWYCKACIKSNKDTESIEIERGIMKESNKMKKETKKPTPPATTKKTPKSSDNSKSKHKSIVESTPASAGFSPHIPTTPMSWEPRSPPTKSNEKPPPVLTDILSLSKGLEMLREYSKKRTLLSADDKEYLERLRDWLPLSDLELILNALKTTKNDLESLIGIGSS